MATLTPLQERFVLHWGEMGTRWGINRTVAQIHAFLFLSEKPLTAEEIVEALSVARSNVSTSLKELQGWGLVRVVHLLGDRRDHFETHHDVWEMFRIIAEERKKREIDPTLSVLRDCVIEAESNRAESAVTRERLAAMLAFFETINHWHAQMRQVPNSILLKAMKLGDKVFRVLGMK